MCWPGFDPNTNHQSNHQVAERLITEFMDFKWVFERLHHDSLESNMNHHGKPAKIIIIIKALYQGLVCAEHTRPWGEGLHIQQCQTRWCLAGPRWRWGWSHRQHRSCSLHFYRWWSICECPDTCPTLQKEDSLSVMGGKKKGNCNESLQSSFLSKATAHKPRDSLAVKWGKVIIPKLGTSSCAGWDGIRSCGTERAHDEIFEVKCYFPF